MKTAHFLLQCTSTLLRCVILLLPLLDLAFVFVPSIAEVSDRVHIERILAHANACIPCFRHWRLVNPLVDALRVRLEALL
jgi:hypothetical protein